MISPGREKRNCYSDNAALITEFVRLSVLFGRLNYLALVRQVDFQYHNSSLKKPNKLRRGKIELELANLFQLRLLFQLVYSSLHVSLRNASILHVYIYIKCVHVCINCR